MPIKYDPNAIAYWTRCPRCYVKHIGRDHNEAILGDNGNWHKPDCPFFEEGMRTTFNAYPIYSWRHKLIRVLPEPIKNALKIKIQYNRN